MKWLALMAVILVVAACMAPTKTKVQNAWVTIPELSPREKKSLAEIMKEIEEFEKTDLRPKLAANEPGL